MILRLIIKVGELVMWCFNLKAAAHYDFSNEPDGYDQGFRDGLVVL